MHSPTMTHIRAADVPSSPKPLNSTSVRLPLAPIMMSQNRQEAIDRRRAENDYKVNLKSEFLIDELYKKTEQIYETQKKILKFIESRSSSVEPITDSSATPSDEKNKTDGKNK